MKTIQILLCLSLFTIGRTQSQSSKTTFNIQVGQEVIEEVILSKYDYKLGKMNELRTLSNLLPGKSYLIVEHISEPSIYTLKLSTGKEIRIAAEQNGTIQLQLGNEISLESNVAAKSDFQQTIQSLNNQFFASLINDFDKAMKENDQATIAKLEKKKDEILVEFIAAMENAVKEMGPSALAYDALQYFDIHKNFDFLNEMSDRFSAKHPNSLMSRSLQERMDKASQVAYGHKAPPFTTTTLEGSDISLVDYRGSYLLIDFWASWCRACRIENPKFVEIYKMYGNKKLNIVNVSIDEDIAALKNAIMRDSLQWPQIHDADRTIYNLYLLSSLPSNFLLNQEGIIIEKNINAEQLEILLSKEIRDKEN